MKQRMFEEATIIIGRKLLTPGQSMTIRVALNNFSIDLHHDGLGDDENGKRMASNYYIERIDDVQTMISSSIDENENKS